MPLPAGDNKFDRSRQHLRLVPSQTRREQERFVSMLVTPKPAENGDSPTQHSSRLLDQVRAAIRFRHYSLRTEDTYLHWIKRFILVHEKRHPAEMGEQEIGQFLSALAWNNG
jgi:hypothetical protein